MRCSEPGVVSVASDVAECISIVLVVERHTIPAIAIDYGYLNERDDLLRASATVIAGLVEPLSRREVQTSMRLLICSGFTEVLVRSDNEPGILALKRVSSDSVEIGRCECQG